MTITVYQAGYEDDGPREGDYVEYQNEAGARAAGWLHKDGRSLLDGPDSRVSWFAPQRGWKPRVTVWECKPGDLVRVRGVETSMGQVLHEAAGGVVCVEWDGPGNRQLIHPVHLIRLRKKEGQ